MGGGGRSHDHGPEDVVDFTVTDGAPLDRTPHLQGTLITAADVSDPAVHEHPGLGLRAAHDAQLRRPTVVGRGRVQHHGRIAHRLHQRLDLDPPTFGLGLQLRVRPDPVPVVAIDI